MIDTVSLYLFSALRIFEQPEVERIFFALEERAESAPGHWGPSPDLRDRYNRAEILDFMRVRQALGEEADCETLAIRRLKAPRYDLILPAAYAPIPYVHLYSVGPLDPDTVPLYFDLGRRLAGALDADFGFVDIIHNELPLEYGERSDYPEYPEVGPYGLRRRTFFGPRVLELLGGTAPFTALNLAPRPCGSGIEIDVVDPPWGGDAAKVLEARRAAAKELRKSGVFARVKGDEIVAGQRWVPMPPLPRHR